MTTFSVDIPVLETERLVLREPRLADFETYLAFATSDRSRFVGGPYDRRGAWRAFSSVAGHWLLLGYGLWTLEDKATGAPAGRVGVIMPDGWPEPELAWHVYEGFEGRGIAYEAATMVRGYAQGTMGFAPLISHIHPDNARSRALAGRMGATVEREAELFGQPALVYRHPLLKGEGA